MPRPRKRTSGETNPEKGKPKKRKKTEKQEAPALPEQSQTTHELDTLLAEMSVDQLHATIHHAVGQNPSLILKMRDMVYSIDDDSQQPPSGPDGFSDWCKCGNCRNNHNTEEAKKCCGYQPVNCLSSSATFVQLCLTENVVALARNFHRDVLARRRQPILDPNRTMRYYAYRQYIFWRWGFLGKDNRKAVPSCCVWKIREKWPDPKHIYVDFIPKRFGLM